MRYMELGRSGIKVSAIAQGSWEMAGNVWGNVEDENSINTIHAAVESGINIIDTAASYGGGRAETVVGKAIKGIREKVVLCTKCGLRVNSDHTVAYDLSPENIRQEVERSLERLDTDYIDLYQFHYPDPSRPVAESLEEMKKLRSEGKIRAIGVSNFNAEQMQEVIAAGGVDSIQLKFNMLNQENRSLIELCAANGIGVITYGSLAGGMLTGIYKTPPTFGENDRRKDFYPFFEEPLFGKARKLVDLLDQIAEETGRQTVDIAVNWVIHQPGVTTSLFGSITPEQARANAKSGDFTLTQEQLARIDERFRAIFGTAN